MIKGVHVVMCFSCRLHQQLIVPSILIVTSCFILFYILFCLAGVSDLNSPQTTKIELVIFVTMGMALAAVWSLVQETYSTPALILVLSGGGCYLLGIPFYLLGEIDPKYHVIWHLFVMAGSCLHWFFTYFFVLHTDIGMDITDVHSVSTAWNNLLMHGSNGNGTVNVNGTCVTTHFSQ